MLKPDRRRERQRRSTHAACPALPTNLGVGEKVLDPHLARSLNEGLLADPVDRYPVGSKMLPLLVSQPFFPAFLLVAWSLGLRRSEDAPLSL